MTLAANDPSGGILVLAVLVPSRWVVAFGATRVGLSGGLAEAVVPVLRPLRLG
jgi:hypothetical protein